MIKNIRFLNWKEKYNKNLKFKIILLNNHFIFNFNKILFMNKTNFEKLDERNLRLYIYDRVETSLL